MPPLPPSPPPPVLMEELVEEVLLRVPPDDPATLVRAALVCKPWCRLVSGRGFRHRFRELHRTPPMLGFCYITYDEDEDEEISRFALTTSFTPPPFDSRHGRVLLRSKSWDGGPFVIWDPITDEKQELPDLPRFPRRDLPLWSAAVFCAAAGICNHLDCQSGSFSVVVACTNLQEMFVYHYSPEVGAWSQTSAPNPGASFLTFPSAPGALVGNALYFICMKNTKILKYELGTREICLIDGPHRCSDFQSRVVLMSTEEGRLGFAYVLKFKLHIWSSEVDPDRDARWTQDQVIDLTKLPPFVSLSRSPPSSQPSKISDDSDLVPYVIPFMSFYTPEKNMSGKKDRRPS
ncbi:hypothetical protein EJB05_14060, partial [Eragrostis curvula]